MGIWDTVPVRRTVLLVAHNGTTLDRLLDVATVFADDLRVRIVISSDLSDPFADTLPEQVAALGLSAVPWSEATGHRHDLIISASHHGGLAELAGPLLVLAHGAGFGKYAPGTRSVFGLAPEWLLVAGKPLADALGVAHPAEIERLNLEVPAAAATAELIGDPCFDDLSALPRDGDGRTVVVSTTWGESSLLGRNPQVIREVLDAGFRTRLIVHPNVCARYGGHQLRLWLAGCLRDGLTLVPPLRQWRAVLASADYVVGDHGSVTVYGSALGKPTVLAAYGDQDVVPGSPAHRLGELAPQLRPDLAIDVQLAHAPATTALAELVTAVPGEAARRLRGTCYRMLELEELLC